VICSHDSKEEHETDRGCGVVKGSSSIQKIQGHLYFLQKDQTQGYSVFQQTERRKEWARKEEAQTANQRKRSAIQREQVLPL